MILMRITNPINLHPHKNVKKSAKRMTNATFFNIIIKIKNAGSKPSKPYCRWKQMKLVTSLLTSNMPTPMTSFSALSTVEV